MQRGPVGLMKASRWGCALLAAVPLCAGAQPSHEEPGLGMGLMSMPLARPNAVTDHCRRF